MAIGNACLLIGVCEFVRAGLFMLVVPLLYFTKLAWAHLETDIDSDDFNKSFILLYFR